VINSQNKLLNNLVVPEDIIEVLKKVNQNINLKVEIGTGLDEIIKDDKPIV